MELIQESPKQLAEKAAVIGNELRYLVSNTLIKCIEYGEILSKLKDACSHGEWEQLVEETQPVSLRVAQRYMQLFKNKDKLDAEKNLTENLKFIVEPKKDAPILEGAKSKSVANTLLNSKNVGGSFLDSEKHTQKKIFVPKAYSNTLLEDEIAPILEGAKSKSVANTLLEDENSKTSILTLKNFSNYFVTRKEFNELKETNFPVEYLVWLVSFMKYDMELKNLVDSIVVPSVDSNDRDRFIEKLKAYSSLNRRPKRRII